MNRAVILISGSIGPLAVLLSGVKVASQVTAPPPLII
jgi:hypothetical protein